MGVMVLYRFTSCVARMVAKARKVIKAILVLKAVTEGMALLDPRETVVILGLRENVASHVLVDVLVLNRAHPV